MKPIFSSSDSAQVALVQSILDVAGIACEIRNETVSQVLPGFAFNPEVWILREEDYEAARDLVSSIKATQSSAA
jgi:hypothetical protein